jgi:hypothetical protein
MGGEEDCSAVPRCYPLVGVFTPEELGVTQENIRIPFPSFRLLDIISEKNGRIASKNDMP